MIPRERIAPLCIIAFSLASSVVYGFAGDWRRCGYWLAGAALNVCVTF